MKKILLVLMVHLAVLVTAQDKIPKPDGSEKFIQKWVDEFNEALRSGTRDSFKTFFVNEHTPVDGCVETKDPTTQKTRWVEEWWSGDKLYDYIDTHRSEILIVFNYSEYMHDDWIYATFSMYGFGESRLTGNPFVVKDGRAYWDFKESIPCYHHRCE